MSSTYYETQKDGTVKAIDMSTGKVIAKSPSLESCLIEGQPSNSLQDGNSNLTYVYSKIWRDVLIDHFVYNDPPTFTAFCARPGMPSMSVLVKWRAMYPELEAAILEAKKIRAERAADKLVEEAFKEKPISKDDVPGVKLKLDTLKYVAKTGDPDAYGEKTTVRGDANAPIMYVIDTGIKREPPPIDAEYREIENGKERQSDD